MEKKTTSGISNIFRAISRAYFAVIVTAAVVASGNYIITGSKEWLEHRKLQKIEKEIAECEISGERLSEDKLEKHVKDCMMIKDYFFSFLHNRQLCLYDAPYAYRTPDCYLD